MITSQGVLRRTSNFRSKLSSQRPRGLFLLSFWMKNKAYLKVKKVFGSKGEKKVGRWNGSEREGGIEIGLAKRIEITASGRSENAQTIFLHF